MPAAQLINSPYDLDARYAKKRTTLWVGYKVHFSQTCEEDAPQLITHVETTQAPISDERSLSGSWSKQPEIDSLTSPPVSNLDKRHLFLLQRRYCEKDIGMDPGD